MRKLLTSLVFILILLHSNIFAQDCNKFNLNSLFISPDEFYDEDCNIVKLDSKEEKRKNCDEHGINSLFLVDGEFFDSNCNILMLEEK